MEDTTPKIEDWMTTIAQNAVQWTLPRRPLYVLKNNTKGFIVRAALQSVAIEKNEIKIVFSLWQLTLSTLLGLCLLSAVAVSWDMIQNPTLGIASIALS